MSNLDTLLEMVEHIEIATIQPGDVIVLRLGNGYTPEQGAYIRDVWCHVTGLDNPVMVLPDDISIEVKRPSDV